jgi:small GTP-binding protein
VELLRFATAGSVDDGKSTLMGRLLYDSKQIFEDRLEAVERTSIIRGHDYVNLALLTDGLRAEREQGITIEVAYRDFATPRRKFIIADTPGHIQYTRNMVTGASSADLALIVVDARKGIVEQTRRHAFLSTLVRIPHLVVCVKKMDLVDYDFNVFEAIKDELREFATRLDVADLSFIPIRNQRFGQRPLGGERSLHRERPHDNDQLGVLGSVLHVEPDDRRHHPRYRGRRSVAGSSRVQRRPRDDVSASSMTTGADRSAPESRARSARGASR